MKNYFFTIILLITFYNSSYSQEKIKIENIELCQKDKEYIVLKFPITTLDTGKIEIKKRIAVYEKVSKFSIKELNDFTVSSLITRNTQDIQQLQMATNMSLRMVLLQPILAVGGIVFAVKTHAPLSIIIAVGIVSLIILYC